MTEAQVIQPISLLELVREFYAAKLDVSFANPARRDASDLTFREFLRCVLRVALAMHAHSPRKAGKMRSNGIVSTSFEALKEEEGRVVERPYTPLYNRRGNVLGASPTKTARMTSTSIISRLLHTSRALIRQRESSEAAPSSSDERSELSLLPLERTQSVLGTPRSPMRILYGPNSPESRSKQPTPPRTAPAQCGPARPVAPHRARARPVTCGGPPVIRLIRPPDL